jgi:hypothetical protein
LGEVLTTPSREKKPCFVLFTIGLFYLDEMLPLEIKQSGSKLLPHSDLRWRGRGVFPEGVSQSFKKRKRDVL